MAAKKKRAAKKPVVVRDENYTPMEQYAIALNEWYKALRKAGFSTDICMSFILDKNSYPDWILPQLPNKIAPIPYEAEEDDD